MDKLIKAKLLDFFCLIISFGFFCTIVSNVIKGSSINGLEGPRMWVSPRQEAAERTRRELIIKGSAKSDIFTDKKSIYQSFYHCYFST